jgi:hypothetical protein
VGELEALLRDLAGDVAEALARPGDDPGEPGDEDDAPGVRSWLLVDDPEQARELLADLAEWLAAVYLRCAGAALPSCWAWHADLVEELLCLRQAHRDAYSGRGASVQRASDWHDRLRPHAVERITKAHGRCELALHATGQEQARPAPRTPFTNALGDIADVWTAHRAQLEPSPWQLAEADRLQHEQRAHRSHR